MVKRVIDISDCAYLHLKHQQLLIDQKGETVGQIAIEDLGVLILQHSAIVLTQQVVIACQKNKVVIVFCDERHLPYSAILPIAEGHTLHNKIMRQQMAISQAVRKRLWQQIVQQKILQQSETLSLFGKDHELINRLATQVRTGDEGNCEAVAAQSYWKFLFGKAFKRDVDLGGLNSLLNYGYAIIRAMVARSICGAGLHPALGLFHKNQYNALCLADDLMEPFRPWVDERVYRLMEQHKSLELNQDNKKIFLDLLNELVILKGKRMPLMIAVHHLMADLKRCYSKEDNKLIYPKMVSRSLN